MTAKSILPYLILLLLIPGASYAQNSECPDLAELNQKWPTYYNDIHLAEPLQELRCGSPQYEIAKALDIIKSVDVPEIGGMYEYVTNYIPRLSIDLRPLYGTTAAYSFPKKLKRHQVGVELYQSFFSFDDQPSLVTIRDIIGAATLVHESRHMHLVKNNDHETCRQGQFLGKDACDKKFIPDWNNANTYSFEILFLKRLLNSNSQYSDIIDRVVLKRYINTIMNNAFNE